MQGKICGKGKERAERGGEGRRQGRGREREGPVIRAFFACEDAILLGLGAVVLWQISVTSIFSC